MFLIDRNNNEAISIEEKTFSDLNFKERQNLQEWICKNTDILGEELLIIQKEFNGFDDTKERLDLLAIDKNGNLAIIENKLDDSGRDVVWQSLKYVSYCSNLTKNDIKNIFQRYLDRQEKNDDAEKKICEFFEVDDFDEIELNNDQRIIMVSANFRKEVTSTVIWLLEHNIKIKCIKVTPYEWNNHIFLDTEQIIPVVNAEEYLIKIRVKNQEEEYIKNRHRVRINFWKKLLNKVNEKQEIPYIFKNITPTKDNSISFNSGYTGIFYVLVITGNDARVEIHINTKSQEENKRVYDSIFEHKEKIQQEILQEKRYENNIDETFNWQRLDDFRVSKISYTLKNVNVFDEKCWDKIIDFMIRNIIIIEKVMNNFLSNMKIN